MASRPDVAAFLDRLTVALAESRVRLTWKADDEVAELGWSDIDALSEIAALASGDLLRTEPSQSVDFTLIWVFCPLVAELDLHLWIHLAERDPWT